MFTIKCTTNVVPRFIVNCLQCNASFECFGAHRLLEDHINQTHGPDVYFCEKRFDPIQGKVFVIVQNGTPPFLPVHFPDRLRSLR
jgi:hypothetical protein